MFKVLFGCCLIIVSSYGQRNGDTLTDRIQDVFGDGTGNRGGFDTIVTPEPIDEPFNPTQFPTTGTDNNGQECTCIPYWQCDTSNAVQTTDNRINPYGEIDVRAGSKVCQDVLDVCCAPSNQATQRPVTQAPPIQQQPQQPQQPQRPQQPPAQNNPQQPQRPRGCGIRNVNGIDFTIAGNVKNEAGFGEFPWTVALLSQNTECLCGGSLIHPNIVLTGAHCVFNLTAYDLKIRAGEWDTQTQKERLPYQELNVISIIVHPSFQSRNLINDVALLVLERPVQLDDHINVICLPSQGYNSNSRDCFASGWGKSVFGQVGRYSVIMKRIPLPIVDFNTCQNELRKTRLSQKFKLHNTFVCAGGEEGVDTCQGDGGSPLVCPIGVASDNRYVQVGSVAWGIGCHDRIPAVYANVALFRNWIDENVRNLGYDPSVYSF